MSKTVNSSTRIVTSNSGKQYIKTQRHEPKLLFLCGGLFIQHDRQLILWRLQSPLPILHVVEHKLGAVLGRVLATQDLDKLHLGIHNIKIDAVVDQVILSGLDVLRRAEVDAERLAHRLDIFVRPRQANELGVELGQVALDHAGRVTCWVARYEDGQNRPRALLVDEIHNAGHLVKLFGAYIWAMCEAEVDLVDEGKWARVGGTAEGGQRLGFFILPNS